MVKLQAKNRVGPYRDRLFSHFSVSFSRIFLRTFFRVMRDNRVWIANWHIRAGLAALRARWIETSACDILKKYC
jgi:hypothetical protein